MTRQSPEDEQLGLLATLLASSGGMDTMLDPRPRCGEDDLRAEAVEPRRPIAAAIKHFDVTEADIRASGAKVDGFGRVKALVPFVTCMACGLHADASEEPGA